MPDESPSFKSPISRQSLQSVALRLGCNGEGSWRAGCYRPQYRKDLLNCGNGSYQFSIALVVFVEVYLADMVCLSQGSSKFAIFIFCGHLLTNKANIVIRFMGPAPLFADDFQLLDNGAPSLFSGLKATITLHFSPSVNDKNRAYVIPILRTLFAMPGQRRHSVHIIPSSLPLYSS